MSNVVDPGVDQEVREALQFLLPPGWLRIELGSGGEDRATARELLAGATELNAKAASMLAALLDGAIAAAREQGAWSLLATTDDRYGHTATGLVTPWDADGEPLDELLALASQDSSATLIEVPDLVCLRVSRVRSVSKEQRANFLQVVQDSGSGGVPSQPLPERALQVSHVLGDPTDSARPWLQVLWSVNPRNVGSQDERSAAEEAFIDLLDAVVGTFRWRS